MTPPERRTGAGQGPRCESAPRRLETSGPPTSHERAPRGKPHRALCRNTARRRVVSVEAMRWARRQWTGGAAAKGVLLLLADHHNSSTGRCDPGTRSLAQSACTDAKQVRIYLDRLRAAGLISWSDGPGRSRRYTLHLDTEVPRPVKGEGCPTAPADSPREVGPPSLRRSKGAVGHPSTVRSGTPRGAGDPTPKPPRNPIESEVVATTAARIVDDWCNANPGTRQGQRAQLVTAAQRLIDDGADPNLLPAVLTEAHRNAKWRVPAKVLGFVYDELRRAAQATKRDAAPVKASTTDARVDQVAAVFAEFKATPAALPAGSEVVDGEVVR